MRSRKGDSEATEALVIPLMGYADYLVKEFGEKHFTDEKQFQILQPDLCYAGHEGAIEAIMRFDPSKNARLTTAADSSIKKRIYECCSQLLGKELIVEDIVLRNHDTTSGTDCNEEHELDTFWDEMDAVIKTLEEKGKLDGKHIRILKLAWGYRGGGQTYVRRNRPKTESYQECRDNK